MAKTRANGIEIEWDSFGERTGEPILLVMGLGAQMLLWDEEFCQRLADRGHWVVRFDNRDVGLSTWFDAHGVPNPMQLMMDAQAGKKLEVAVHARRHGRRRGRPVRRARPRRACTWSAPRWAA